MKYFQQKRYKSWHIRNTMGTRKISRPCKSARAEGLNQKILNWQHKRIKYKLQGLQTIPLPCLLQANFVKKQRLSKILANPLEISNQNDFKLRKHNPNSISPCSSLRSKNTIFPFHIFLLSHQVSSLWIHIRSHACSPTIQAPNAHVAAVHAVNGENKIDQHWTLDRCVIPSESSRKYALSSICFRRIGQILNNKACNDSNKNE